MSFFQTELRERLERKLHTLQQLRPLPLAAVQKLREEFEIEMTYNSNAIEGNSLTLKETFLVIHEGLTIKGKPLKDHLEAKDHYEALEFLYELMQQDSRPTLSEHLIRSLHQLILKKTDEEFSGVYRTGNVRIGGSDHIPTDAVRVPIEMRNLMQWFIKESKNVHPVEFAAMLHHKLVFIHPFFDGNGRTARLVMNVVLLRAGYPLVVILKNDRSKYYRSLDKADKGDYVPFVRFIAQATERSLDMYLKAVVPATGKKEQFVSLSEASRHVPYSTKYLNLLARQGKLEAHKQGRNWLTTKGAVERYINQRERERSLKA